MVFLPVCATVLRRGYDRTGATRQKDYSPKLAKITPMCKYEALHCVDMTVRAGTIEGQARVTGRIG